MQSIVTALNRPNLKTRKIWLFIHSFKDINHSLWSTAEPVFKEHKKANMESSWSAGMNMTCCFLGRKQKERRNEQIKEWKQMSFTSNNQNISSQASMHFQWKKKTTWSTVFHLMSEKLLDSYRSASFFNHQTYHSSNRTHCAITCLSQKVQQEKAVFVNLKIHTVDKQQTCISRTKFN